MPQSLETRTSSILKIQPVYQIEYYPNYYFFSPIACRQEEVPRTFKEIVAVSNHNKKEIGRVFMKIKNKLEIILKTPNTNNDHLEIIESGDFICRFCGNLQLSREIQRAATTIGTIVLNFSSKYKKLRHL